MLPYLATIFAVAGLVGRVRAARRRWAAVRRSERPRPTAPSTGTPCGPRPARSWRTRTSPYSSFPVGAAALVDDGRVVSGCNVENASYGVTLCAECTLVVPRCTMTGGGRLVAFACVDGAGSVLMPCGRCRQLLWEHRRRRTCSWTPPRGVAPMTEVLPDAFGPARPHRPGPEGPVTEQFAAVDVIRTKRDGGELSDAQIDWVVDAYTRGAVAEEQMSALAMAILLQRHDPRGDLAAGPPR